MSHLYDQLRYILDISQLAVEKLKILSISEVVHFHTAHYPQEASKSNAVKESWKPKSQKKKNRDSKETIERNTVFIAVNSSGTSCS